MITDILLTDNFFLLERKVITENLYIDIVLRWHLLPLA